MSHKKFCLAQGSPPKIQDELDSIVYPVLTLPAEITSHIFTQSLPIDATPSRYAAPLLLTQVCRLWRTIALATPNLWQSIVVKELGPGDLERLNDPAKLVEMWLQRSAGLPLSLFVHLLNEVLAQSIIDTCLVHHHRWSEVEVLSFVNIDARDREFPVLRKVRLSHRDEPRHTIRILNAPALREACITTVSNTQCDVQLPWAQLSHLRFSTHGLLAACLPILSHCSDLLVHLTHSSALIQPIPETMFDNPHLTLPTLESLDVTLLGPSIIPHLTLPRLQHLTVSGHIPSAIEPLRALFSRSFCSLQSLHLTVAHELLVDLFQLVPTVVTLALQVYPPALPEVVQALSSTDILPAMHTLAIDVGRARDEYDSLIEVLRSRRGNDTLKVSTLNIRPHGRQHNRPPGMPADFSPLPVMTIARFRDLEKCGLKIRIEMDRNWRLSHNNPERRIVVLDTFEE
ncbi:F-box domain-containing protein [Mycena venus]|uniref:F-box domain-containing protein n=1 Tax=Mycena venus TaxID=2733690 RepID=A0A8H7CES6_9AGAR|nr:F-box domain-containing protein [Mycena venus]